MESDEDDFDIDDILQGLDLDAKPPTGSTGPKSMQTAAATKTETPQAKGQQQDIMSMFQAEPNQKPPAKMQSAAAANKAVRFSSESGGNTKPAQAQPLPTQPLSDLYFNPSGDTKPDPIKGVQRPLGNPGSAKNLQSNAGARPAQKSSANDWLGLGDDKSPAETPPQQRSSNLGFPQRTQPPLAKKVTTFDSEEEETSDDNDLMRTLGLRPLSNKSSSSAPATSSKPFAPAVNNPIAGSAGARQPPKSAASERSSSLFKTQQISPPPTSSNYPSSLTPKSGPGSLEMLTPIPPSPSVPMNNDPKLPPFPNPQTQPVKTVLDSLPFLSTLTTATAPIHSTQQSDGYSGQNQGDNTQTANTGPQSQGPKKRTRAVAGTGNNYISDANTLTLPSHLIDHEQLKAMASSLKTLYETQMDNLEKGYTEQIEFVHQSSRRKEELLKDEIKAIQKNYDNRLERLKNELQESETKVPQKLQQELNAVVQQLAVASSAISNGNVENNSQFDKISLVQEINKSVENKLASFGQQIEDVIVKSMQAQSSNPNSYKQMEQSFVKLQEIMKTREDDAKKMHDKIDDSDIKMSSNIRKLIREQQKMKDKIVKAAVSTISNELNANNQERLHRKEKTVSQVKEFHKDLRRLIYDLEVKNETMHKSQLSIEMEQKNISQTIRDLNSFLHTNANQQVINTGTGSNNISSQMSTMHAMQQQAQNEMEMKMLREERNTLSESIAKMQVERHKLNEERVLLEKDKLEFEREKNRIRELEVQLRVKVSEAEEKIMQAEAVRREETQKSKDCQAKMREVESNHMYIKDQFHTAEQKLQMREQKLYQDKTELIREKEFLDKLRDQLLCPGCLKSLTVPSSGHFVRSEGDGLDLSNVTKLPNPSTTFFNTDEPYFRKESKFLDYLYNNH